jgi:hypothetical protein
MCMPTLSGEITASDIIVAQAVPHLIDYATHQHHWPYGHSVENYLWPEGGLASTPTEHFEQNLRDIADPYYQFAQPTQRALILRDASDDGRFYNKAPTLTIPGFRAVPDGSWTYYLPPGCNRGPTINRTYMTLPSSTDRALSSLLSLGDDFRDTLQRDGVHFKVGRNLNELHSVVIYDDGSLTALSGIAALLERLKDQPHDLADQTVLTAVPILPGVGRAPEVPTQVQELYRQTTNVSEDGLSWTILAGLLLRTSIQFALAEVEPVRVSGSYDSLLAAATEGARTHAASILTNIGIDPVTMRQTA